MSDEEDLKKALDELYGSYEEAKFKIIKIKDKIKNQQPISDKEKEMLLKFKRSMDLLGALKKDGKLKI